MKILIDADGCPVVDITVNLGRKYNINTIIMCDTSHIINKVGVDTVVLSKGSDSVDFALVNKVSKGDIVVTQDYGLAAMVLSKGGYPINQNGMIYSNENISIIKELVNKVKTVHIISNNKNYTKLENELEKEGIYITVNNNPRKSLKRAILVINMDFKNIANYNYNRTMTIIDLTGNLKLPKGFEGIYIKSVKVRNR